MTQIPSFTTAHYDAGANAVGGNVLDDLNSIKTVVNGNIDTGNIATNGVGTAEIANNAVTNDKIIANAVRQSQATYTTSNSGMLVAQAGPNYGAGGGGVRLARIRKSVEWNGTGTNSVVFTFASDCIEGNPGFSDTPSLMGLPVVASGEVVGATILTANVTSANSSQITFTFTDVATNSTAIVNIEFGVMGPIA